MRLFVAIEIPKEIRAAIALLLSEFRAISPQTKWVRPDNLHLTLKFLGETDAAKLSEVQSTLNSIHSAEPVTMDVRGVGFFPNAKRPRIFWTGLQVSSNLREIATEIDGAIHRLGLELESRPFTPHLTLARFNGASISTALQSAIAENAFRNLGSFSTHQFQLIESKLKSTGAEYTALQSFSFVTEA